MATALLAALASAVLAFSIAVRPAAAQAGQVTFVDFGMESEFPQGIRFYAQIETAIPVVDVRVIYDVGNRNVTQYNYLDLPAPSSTSVDGELFINTNSPERYVPPGSMVRFYLEVLDSEGNLTESERKEEVLLDSRYEWETVTDGPVTIYYHGPVRSRAETLAAETRKSLEIMQPITGAEIETPISVMLYNNNAEMIQAVVPRSTTISRELITEGQAFDDENTVLVLAGRADIGTATHEITHILVGRATDGSALVPFWLNEGLAEYGNQDPTVSFTQFLEWGVGTGRLPSFRSLNNPPGDPNLTLVGYGIGRSAVRYMIEEFGNEKMAELLAALGRGVPIDRAASLVYEISLDQLENAWRASIGADPYVTPAPAPTSAAPSPTPARSGLQPLTLESITEAGRGDAATEPSATAETTEETATPATQPEPTTASDEVDPPSGGVCNSAGPGGRVEAGFAIGLAALFGLAGWRATRGR